MTAQWLEALRAEVNRTSQTQVAQRLGVSKTVISQVVNEKYPGDMHRIQQLVEGALLQRSVNCPILGEITSDICLQHQKRPFSASNPVRVRLHKACRSGCPHSKLEENELLKNPIRLHVESALEAGRHKQNYDADAVIRRLERQARRPK